jgi:hypothetical protein
MNAYYYDWHLWRGLVILLMLGVFGLFALVAFWRMRHARRNARSGKAPKGSPLAVPATTGARDPVATDHRTAARESRSVAPHQGQAA